MPVYQGYIVRLPAHQESIPAAVLSKIYACWALREHDLIKRVPWRPVLRLKEVRQLTKSDYVLGFELWGTSDMSALFVVGNDAEVRRAYWYPYSL
jgi:hypothetical protein